MKEPICTRRCARWGSSARSSIALVIAVVALAWAGPARGQDRDYQRANELLANGDVAEAAQAFEAAAASAERADRRADALFSAALLYEERLAKPKRAVLLYKKIVDEHGESRVALASSRRLRELSSLLGDDDDSARALGAWKKLLHDYADLGADAAAARAKTLLSEHPGWSGTAMVWRWLGDQARMRGDLRGAADAYENALEASPSPDEQFVAVIQLAEIALSSGDLKKARRLIERVASEVDPGKRRVLADMRSRLDSSWRRQQIGSWSYLVALGCLVALIVSLRLAAGSTRAALAAAKSPPPEVLFVLPLIAVLIAMSLTSNEAIGSAVIIIGAAGLAFTWLSGSALDAGRRSVPRIVVHLLLIAVGVAAVVFIALEREQLLDQIAETVRFGPDG